MYVINKNIINELSKVKVIDIDSIDSKRYEINDFNRLLKKVYIPEDININNINGYWHRDAYSLFNNEKVDLSLPPFYYTMLIPLDHVNAYSGGTEFILGSHKTNLSKMNIKTNKQLCEWINKNNDIQYAPELNIGDICIFHGYTIHRGLFNHTNTNRNMIYCVFKKNWYNDEPIENMIL